MICNKGVGITPFRLFKVFNGEQEDESEGEDAEEPPYRSLSPCALKRYGTLSSLERLDHQQQNRQHNLTDQTQGQSLPSLDTRS